MHKLTTLDNGLRLITTPMPHTRSVSVGFFVGTGSRYESDEQAGISHYLEHMSFKGTTRRPTARDICSAIEGVGGIFNGSTDKEITIYWCKVAQPHFEVALDVLADMLMDSALQPAEVEKERQVIIEEINMGKDSPSQEAALLIDSLLWPGHPLGRDIAGTRESVERLTRETMVDFLSRQYQPANAVLSIAGAITTEQVLPMATRITGIWQAGDRPPAYQAYSEKLERRVVVQKRPTKQVQLCLALPGVSLTDPRRLTLDLLNVVLGEGMSSRLFAEIRDKLGLAYSLYSYVEHFLDTGAIIVAAGVEEKNLRVAIAAILDQLFGLKQTLSADELNKAKELSKGRLLLSMEDSRNVAAWVGGQEILTNRILTVDEIIARIDATTLDQVRQVAEELLVADKLRLSVVGPITTDEQELERMVG
ncbi:MAG: insulinase family protein [Chloroflexi bacterium]|nr:insulinase family protein [Chloroflexota bacterium]